MPRARGKVRVAIRFSGINPIDRKIRSGAMRPAFDLTLPHILGVEFSGLVDEVGQRVTDLHVGDAVFGPASGTYATHTLASAACSASPKI